MVKSLRYDQKSCDDSAIVSACRVQRTRHANAGAYLYGHATPDRDTAPYSHPDACVELSTAEPCGGVGAARTI